MILDLTYRSLDAPWWPFVFILLAGWLPTDIWRFLGIASAGGVRDDATAAKLARTVATALVAAVIAQLVLYPSGELAKLPTWLRVASIASGFGTYVFGGRRILAGIAVAEVVLVGGALLLGAAGPR
ncbi:AzlD domain-containing protein [Antarcticirhabdus aurantiaca]|uniref:AzlD domain-containing protein n=1 Tax=Antarcticirhabdus aurantiaca TaxID=2606717 RepID=A0ACD4NV35_9HYPH|nr:AzlD domain-containing protein [Antarcticirhabdus aurantiaca]WAJ30865.1 AzlD domain-containing protein [Jeongeuplla avenae]